jgi:hypothetical protein
MIKSSLTGGSTLLLSRIETRGLSRTYPDRTGTAGGIALRSQSSALAAPYVASVEEEIR